LSFVFLVSDVFRTRSCARNTFRTLVVSSCVDVRRLRNRPRRALGFLCETKPPSPWTPRRTHREDTKPRRTPQEPNNNPPCVCIVGLNSSMVRYLTDFVWRYGNADIFEFFIQHYTRFALDICQSTNELHSTIVYGNLELTEVWLANHNELIRMDDNRYALLLQSCETTARLSHQQDLIKDIRQIFQDQYQRRHLFDAIVSNTP
jgi:hypothetical protein